MKKNLVKITLKYNREAHTIWVFKTEFEQGMIDCLIDKAVKAVDDGTMRRND